MDRLVPGMEDATVVGLAGGSGLSELLSAVLAVDPARTAARTGTASTPDGHDDPTVGAAVPHLDPTPVAADLMARAVATLPPDVGAFVHAYFRDGQPIDAAAARLGISRLDALALRSAAVTRLTEALVEIRRT